MAPERDASQVATSHLTLEGAPNMAIDGTERRRQRPQDATAQQAHYSGKKKAHTDKNILLVNEMTSKVVYLGPLSLAKHTTRKPPIRRRSPIPSTLPLTKTPVFKAMSLNVS
jgi:hypothetical protein